MQPAPSISSAPSTYTARPVTSLASSTGMPCCFRRSVLCTELDTAPATRTGMRASASMNWLTVEPVPTPTMLPGWT